jgi:diguanylate cyclase (GGDEF)-like protein
VELIKSEKFFRREYGLSKTGLVTSVNRLATCVTGEHSPDPDAAIDAVRGAVSAAHEAEHDIADHKKRLAHYEQLAVTDELTGLLNRRGFEDAIRRTMLGAKRYNEKGVLIFIDLDGFKPVNDTHGHAAGDAVLVRVAELLSENVRGTDFTGRLGGDEFAILLTRSDWNNGLKRAEAFDQLINGASVEWEGATIAIAASFGVQTYGPEDDLSQVLKSADDAMYAAKRARA